jgi:hypothetical protein
MTQWLASYIRDTAKTSLWWSFQGFSLSSFAAWISLFCFIYHITRLVLSSLLNSQLYSIDVK